MGTRANVVFFNGNNYEFTHVSTDGYVKELGTHLFEHFKEKEVKELFKTKRAINNIVTLEKEIDNKEWFLKNGMSLIDYNKKLSKTDNKIINGAFVKYWLKENYEKYKKQGLLGTFYNKSDIHTECNEEYVYLFEGGKWFIAHNNELSPMEPIIKMSQKNAQFTSLSRDCEALIKFGDNLAQLDGLIIKRRKYAFLLYERYKKLDNNSKNVIDKTLGTDQIEQIILLHKEQNSINLADKLNIDLNKENVKTFKVKI